MISFNIFIHKSPDTWYLVHLKYNENIVIKILMHSVHTLIINTWSKLRRITNSKWSQKRWSHDFLKHLLELQGAMYWIRILSSRPYELDDSFHFSIFSWKEDSKTGFIASGLSLGELSHFTYSTIFLVWWEF